MKDLVNRLKEPSTWSGLGMLLVAFHLPVPDGLWGGIAQLGMAAASVASMLISEKSQ